MKNSSYSNAFAVCCREPFALEKTVRGFREEGFGSGGGNEYQKVTIFYTVVELCYCFYSILVD